MTRLVAALVIGLSLASPLHAAADIEESRAHEVAEEMEGETHGELHLSDLLNWDFLGTVLNFTALLIILGWAIRKKGNPALAERRAEVEKELAEAQRLRAEAEARHQATAARLEKLDQEMIQIRADMIKAGEAERDRIVSDAEEKAARMRKDTNFLIEQQLKQLRQELTQQAATAAVAAAQDLLRERTTEEDQTQLAEAYLARLDDLVEERGS
jgi:F-type H+-transporting ATPase subunit b